MAKFNISRLQMEEPPFRYVADCKKDEIDENPDFFSTGQRQFRRFDRIRVFCPDDLGFWVRTYWVVQSEPLKVASEGKWKRVSKPEDVEVVKPGTVTDREIFVPMFCDPGDLNEFGHLKGAPEYVDNDRKWEVRGESTGRGYATRIATRDDALEIIHGRMAYQTVPGKAAA